MRAIDLYDDFASIKHVRFFSCKYFIAKLGRIEVGVLQKGNMKDFQRELYSNTVTFHRNVCMQSDFSQTSLKAILQLKSALTLRQIVAEKFPAPLCPTQNHARNRLRGSRGCEIHSGAIYLHFSTVGKIFNTHPQIC